MVMYNSDMSGEIGGVCAAYCDGTFDCPSPPATGTAPVACGDAIGMGDQCYLSCEAGESCPDDMECALSTFCMWRY